MLELLSCRGVTTITRCRTVSRYCFLFSGQGSQRVGMCKKMLTDVDAGQLPRIAELFALAKSVFGFDLKGLFLDGPQSVLDETVHCQPAVVLASLAALESLKQKMPEVKCKAAAGFSVGEITALMAANSLSLEQGFSLIKVRSKAMQEACKESASCMLMVSGLEKSLLQEVITRTESSHSHACIANYIFPNGFVISGNTDRVAMIEEKVRKLGAKAKHVKVSGAFHSRLMASAVPKFRAVLDKMELKYPSFPVYSNLTGLPYGNVEDIKTGLALQVTNPVLWQDTICHMMNKYMMDIPGSGSWTGDEDVGKVRFMELGYGRQLKGILKRINRTAYRNCDTVTV